MTTQSPNSTSRIAAAVSTGKDLFALLRDVALAALAALLILFPDVFNDRLTRAGFEEGSFAGLKWKAKLIESDVGLKEARAQLNDLSAQLTEATALLKEAGDKVKDPAFERDIAKVVATTQSTKDAAARVQANVSSLITANAPLVEKATTSDRQWGVVYGGDTRLEQANYETGPIAKKFGISNAAIFLDKNGSYRSVSVQNTLEAANQILERAKQRRADAYVVRMEVWCPVRTQKEGYQQCMS